MRQKNVPVNPSDACELPHLSPNLRQCTQHSLSWQNLNCCLFVEHIGFSDGSIQFDDKGSSAPENASSLPDGNFGEDTLYFYCCRNDGFTRDPLSLPNNKPFVLLRYESSRCQTVEGECRLGQSYYGCVLGCK